MTQAERPSHLAGEDAEPDEAEGLQRAEHRLDDRAGGSIAAKLFLSHKTVEAHISQIFAKLDLRESAEHHRRVLAVLAFLRAS